MPHCKKCDNDHYNFASCPAPQPPVPMAGDNPWGTPFSRSPNSQGYKPNLGSVQVLWTQPIRRTGVLTEPPEAA